MLKQIAIAGALAIVASSSFASGVPGDEPEFYPSNYVGFDAGRTTLTEKSVRQNSYGFYLGYEFAPNFALELGGRRLGNFDGCCHNLIFEQTAISLVAGLPLGKLSIFSRLGYNKLKITAKPPHVPTETSSGSLAGVGVSFAFSPTVSARVELQKPSKDLSNVSFGVTIRY